MTHVAGLAFRLLRLAFTAYCLLTSVYCLMAYIPFTYQQVIEFQVVAGTGTFARFHPWIYWIAFVCGAWTLADDYRPGTRALVGGFLLAGAAGGVVLMVSPLLEGIPNEPGALVWAGVWLLPLLWVAIVDLAGPGRRLTWNPSDPGEDWRVFWACLASGVAIGLVYAGITLVRFPGPSGPGAGTAGPAGVIAWSVLLHVLAFLALFAALSLVRGVASMFHRATLVEFLLTSLAGTALLTAVVRTVIFSAVSMVGTAGFVMAVCYAAALVVAAAGWAVRLTPEEQPVRSGIELALRHYDIGAGAPLLVRVLLLAGWMALAYALAVATAVMDWNYLVQKLGVLAIWTLGFTLIYGTLGRRDPRGAVTALLLAVPILALAGHRVLSANPGMLEPAGLTAANRSAVLDRYAGYDVSFRILHDVVRSEPARAGVDMGQFYALLERQTNIPRTVKIEMPDLKLVPRIEPTSARKPHIFIIVIDSLRQDYLSPYNTAVTFTPAMDASARESTVFRNAFTRYGATGLSEPSIWTGALVPHQQYPAAYGPSNNLQKLLRAENYQAYVSIDTPLHGVLGPWPELVELDRNIPNKDYDLGRSLTELARMLRARDAADGRPVFAYTQPQNIHVSAITREGASVPAGESYGGFYAPYASRLRRLDSAFGTFIENLRQLGMYDDSIVVLTSDHGDSLGEEGRWGHAYTIYPEIARIPLIVHLPSWLRGLSVDPEAVSFNTDITPSLYYVLGQRPVANEALFGRPLFTDTPAERMPYLRDVYVMASSYGPVYGVLSDNGRSLYIADATSYRDQVFDLTSGPGGTGRAVSAATREAGVRSIHDAIRELVRVYRVPIEP